MSRLESTLETAQLTEATQSQINSLLPCSGGLAIWKGGKITIHSLPKESGVVQLPIHEEREIVPVVSNAAARRKDAGLSTESAIVLISKGSVYVLFI